MIALDLNLAGAIDHLGEVKDGFEGDMAPSDPWASHHLGLIDTQYELARSGKTTISGKLEDSMEAMMTLPFFSRIAATLPEVKHRSRILTIPLHELVLNALEIHRSTGEPISLRALLGERGILVGSTNKNPNNFDPHKYVEEKRGWFYRDGIQTRDGAIQRGRGFQGYLEDNRICVFFDRPSEDELFTGILVPFSLESYDLRTGGYDELLKAALKRYMEMGEIVGFQFDPEWHNPPHFPDLSHESEESLAQKIAEVQPALVEEYARIRKIIGLRMEEKMFNHYLEPEKHLL